MIGIISYLPEDPELRIKRKEGHLEQLSWLKNNYPNEQILPVYQNYRDGELPMRSEFVFDHGIGMNPARNLILDKFYHSNEDILLLLDDDRWFYDYYGVNNLLSDLITFHEFAAIQPLDPVKTPFKDLNYKHIDIIQNNWILERCSSLLGTGMFIFNNTLKYYGKEYYFDTTIKAENLGGYEDIDLFCRILRDRLPIYKCNQLIVKTKNLHDSTLFTGKEDRLEKHKENIKVTCSHYLDIGVTTEGSLKNVHQTAEKVHMIPRTVPYKPEDNIKPKEKKSNQRKLF